MNPVRLIATIAIAGVCAMSSVLTVGMAQNISARVAYARTAHEAQSVARTMRRGAVRAPLTVAPLLSAGSIARARRDLTGRFGADVERVGVEDRTLVFGTGALRAVVVPYKDADDWDIVADESGKPK